MLEWSKPMKPKTRTTVLWILPGLLAITIGAATGQKAQPRAPAGTSSARLRALLDEKVKLLKEIEQGVRAMRADGTAGPVEVQRAVIAVIRADLERNHTKAERIALRQKWVEAAKELEQAAESAVRQGMSRSDLFQARIDRIEAEIGLERERLSPESKPPRPPRVR
jgi:hypothetical protein